MHNPAPWGRRPSPARAGVPAPRSARPCADEMDLEQIRGAIPACPKESLESLDGIWHSPKTAHMRAVFGGVAHALPAVRLPGPTIPDRIANGPTHRILTRSQLVRLMLTPCGPCAPNRGAYLARPQSHLGEERGEGATGRRGADVQSRLGQRSSSRSSEPADRPVIEPAAAASTRIATSSTSLAAIRRDDNTPVTAGSASTVNSIAGCNGQFHLPSALSRIYNAVRSRASIASEPRYMICRQPLPHRRRQQQQQDVVKQPVASPRDPGFNSLALSCHPRRRFLWNRLLDPVLAGLPDRRPRPRKHSRRDRDSVPGMRTRARLATGRPGARMGAGNGVRARRSVSIG